MAGPTAIAMEFQRRRSAVWRSARRWAAGVLPICITLPLLHGLEVGSPVLFWAIVLPLGCLALFSAFRIVAAVNTLYKCPACGKQVTEGDGIALNPRTCPHCGAALV